MKRVKVYQLIGARWVDRGTAFCFGHFSQDGSEALLTARSERNFQDVVLTTTIRSSDVYQRQQDTLIVWTEPDGVDYALSFQEPEGCAEVWNFIDEVQRHMSTAEENANAISSSPSLGSMGSDSASTQIIRTGRLPPPELSIIPDIDSAIKTLARMQNLKERICEHIQAENYIKMLIDIMAVAERDEDVTSLHALNSLIMTILTLNDHSMYEHILEDDLFLGVVGMLEYDRELPGFKANYREFLSAATEYHEPIPFSDPSIQKKIHHTYRLQFLKDVALARSLDDSTFNVLNSCIIFNQIDIISHIQQDQTFLRKIVRMYVDEDILNGGGNRKRPESSNGELKPPSDSPLEGLSEEDALKRRAEVILLIQQLCAMGKNVQLPARMTLFRSLVDRGILFAVQWALGQYEKADTQRAVINAGGEILSALLDHDINGVRGHVLKQVVALDKERTAGKKGAENQKTILEMACCVMATSKDLAVQSLVGDALKTWLDVPQDANAAATSEAHPGPAKQALRKDEPGTERFMEYFYKDCVKILLRPFDALADWQNCGASLSFTREQTNQHVYLCDLLHNFVQQHNFRSHFLLMSSGILPKLPTLFKARDKHLQHASFRIFRLILKQANPNMLAQLIKLDLLKPILDLTLRESRRDNLLSCSCQDYFTFMMKENLKELIKHCMVNHEDEIKALCKTPLGATRFQMFIQRYERNNEPPPPEEVKTEKSDLSELWVNRSGLDIEEESYFNGDDDDDDIIPAISTQWSRSGSLPFANQRVSLKRKRNVGHARNISGFSFPKSGLVDKEHKGKQKKKDGKASLVDYDDDESSGDEIGPHESEQRTISPSPPPSLPDPDEFDDDETADEDEKIERMLEELHSQTSSRPESPAPGMMSTPALLRPGEKRRRDEDEDEDEMERLVKTKKPNVGSRKASAPVKGTNTNGASKDAEGDDNMATGDDPPSQPPAKKLKLKIGSLSTSTNSTAKAGDSESEPGPKDGDAG
ncbi:DUF625-domain-containing protein [Cylindrobasidium torrendii FP15055 ss-10]|uniref:DUF625-domain-containing protein n=1 Tax=Cylindrobasidium torrendii FP15055 ss-10 TaxID=1314674 RepID=A0A0D7BTR9_9AGAR|nr:DUF625-domain-containing protein [Cylindrobasidium torrendii FP15055 ss-10]